MNSIKIFENKEFGKIRTMTINNEPWFVGKDVAEVLGYSNTRKALSDHVDDYDKKDGVTICDSLGREQKPVVINEIGLYSLILSSKLPKAKKFKHWITSTVLPTIRKTGGYVENEKMFIDTYLPFADETTKMLFSNTLAVMKQQTEIIKKQNTQIHDLEIKNKKQSNEITEMKPKVSYYDIILQCKDLVLVSVIAKDYGWTAKKMNEFLHDKGIQYKRRGTWLLYSRYANSGYTGTRTYTTKSSEGEEHSFICTCWTQKGRLFIYDLLKKDGILPIVEKDA